MDDADLLTTAIVLLEVGIISLVMGLLGIVPVCRVFYGGMCG